MVVVMCLVWSSSSDDVEAMKRMREQRVYCRLDSHHTARIFAAPLRKRRTLIPDGIEQMITVDEIPSLQRRLMTNALSCLQQQREHDPSHQICLLSKKVVADGSVKLFGWFATRERER